MHDILSRLQNAGCDVDGALHRMLDDEEFYISCLEPALHDPAFETLSLALKNQDLSQAFDAAHTLKGVLGNMGLDPLYDITVKIVEPLRVHSTEHVLENQNALLKKRDEFIALLL